MILFSVSSEKWTQRRVVNEKEDSLLAYKNGKDILPTGLLKELQKYIQGELIYIPKMSEEKRAGWGESNGTRHILSKRNQEIFGLYHQGMCIPQIASIYSLSEDSIKKILTNQNKQRMS